MIGTPVERPPETLDSAPARHRPAVVRAVAWLRFSHLGIRFTRYSIGSVIAVITSETVFVICYGSGATGTTPAAALAFVAGAVPNYVLNRRWAWQRRGRPRLGREVVLYVIVSIASLVTAAVTTGVVHGATVGLTHSHFVLVAIVAATYLATNGVLFILKFVVYDLVVFAEDRQATFGE